jgi:hypothetical protein
MGGGAEPPAGFTGIGVKYFNFSEILISYTALAACAVFQFFKMLFH